MNTNTTTYTAAPHTFRETVIRTVRGWMSAYALHRRYRKTYAELSLLTEAELTDLGMSRYQLSDVARKAVYGA